MVPVINPVPSSTVVPKMARILPAIRKFLYRITIMVSKNEVIKTMVETHANTHFFLMAAIRKHTGKT